MTASNFPAVSSIFGFLVTAISLLAFVGNICRHHLPSNKLKISEALLEQTEQFFRHAVEEGLLTEPCFVRHTEFNITILKTTTYDLRCQVYKATNLRQDFAEFFRGTSRAIGSACQALKDLRAEVVTRSEEGRCKLMEINSFQSSSPPTGQSALPCGPDPRNHFDHVPADRIPRPRSCPPALSTWKSGDAPMGCIPMNPPPDPTRSDLDAQATGVQNCTTIAYTSVTLGPGT